MNITAHSTAPPVQIARPVAPDAPIQHGDDAAAEDDTLLLSRTLSGVFDQSFDLYKRHFKTLILIAAWLFFPTQILLHGLYNLWLRPLEAHLQTASGDADTVGLLVAFLGSTLVGVPEYGLPGILSICIMALTSGPLCVAVSDILLGRSAGVQEAYRRAAPSMLRLLFGWIFAALIAFGIATVTGTIAFLAAIFIGVALGNQVGPGVMLALLFVGLIATYLLSIAALARFALFTSPLATLEGLSLTGVWERNQQLVGRLHFRHTSAAAAFLPVMVFGLQYLILLSSSQTINTLHLSPFNEFIIGTALTSVITLFFQPYIIIVITALYYDYRIRGEGLDVVMLAARLPLPEPDNDPAGRAPHEPAAEAESR